MYPKWILKMGLGALLWTCKCRQESGEDGDFSNVPFVSYFFPSPSYLPAMMHLKDRDLREKVYKASIQRASEIHNDKNNVPLIYEILTLRKEMAEMLGYKTYADLSIAKKMASSVDEVRYV